MITGVRPRPLTDVGVSGKQITHVGGLLPSARQTIDCTGLVVSPGFIDLHSHAQSLMGARLQALDGSRLRSTRSAECCRSGPGTT